MAGESARARATRLRRSAEHWNRGSEAEESTGTALMALPPSWTVLDHPAWPGGRFENVDHVVIGPGGVFVIDTKSWPGRVTIENGVLLRDGRDDTPALCEVSAAARSLVELVPSLRPDHVHGVVCVADGPHRVASVADVLVCSPARLVAEVVGRTEVLPGGLSGAIATDVARRLRRTAD